jgi:glucose uptake protein GlcU
MIVYYLYKTLKNQTPFVRSDIVIPAFISGVMWAIAEIAWFVANGRLGFTVTFPAISIGPGFIGAMWGIFYFNEIKGQRNYLIFTVAMLVALAALVMVGFSH